jgi:flagellar basal-body rod modification protein FlgD
MSMIDPTSTATQAAASSSASSTSGLNQLDNTQTFLQLLVAQLQNQDPDNPTDPTAFMTEIAQLTAVQSQTTLDAEEQTVAADSMIGQTVSGLTSGGTAASGVVTSVLLSSSGSPELQLGTGSTATDMPLTSVTQVSATASTSTGSTGSSPS